MLTTITVNTLVDQADGSITDGTISLRDAIAKASTSDVINFAPALTSSGPAILKLTLGALLIDRTRTIQGPGANLLTIDASGNDPTPLLNNGDGSRVFTVVRDPNRLSPITVIINGLTFAGGDVNGDGGGILTQENLTLSNVAIVSNAATQSGGGIYQESGNFSLTNSTILDNKAGGGGGLYFFTGTTSLNNDAITLNSSSYSGGGVYSNQANLGIVNCTVSENSTMKTVPAGGTLSNQLGGGIYNSGALNISGSEISNNMVAATALGDLYLVDFGGGGIANYGNLSLTSCTVSGNSGDLQAIHSLAGDGNQGGGGILNVGTLTAIGSTISSNHFSYGGTGGGIQDFGICTIAECTIAYNSGDDGGGINGTIELLVNSIVANNEYNNVGGSYTGSFNFIGTLTLGPLQNNGGPTLTHALPQDSPAIDGGNPAATPGIDGVPLNDQRGAPYTRRYNGRIDIGALEYQPTPTPALPGDYNRNNVVDSADYVLWRNTLGTNVTSYSGADGDGNGTITQNDYAVWRAHFGQTAGAGATADVDSAPNFGEVTGSAIELVTPIAIDGAVATPKVDTTEARRFIVAEVYSRAGALDKPRARSQHKNSMQATNGANDNAIMNWLEGSLDRATRVNGNEHGNVFDSGVSHTGQDEIAHRETVSESLSLDVL